MGWGGFFHHGGTVTPVSSTILVIFQSFLFMTSLTQLVDLVSGHSMVPAHCSSGHWWIADTSQKSSTVIEDFIMIHYVLQALKPQYRHANNVLIIYTFIVIWEL